METRKCCKCRLMKHVNHFYKHNKNRSGYQTCCASCTKDRNHESRGTLHGFLLKILQSTRQSSKRKKTRGRSAAVATSTLTISELREIWDRQEGLCYYSKLLMSIVIGSDWLATIERLDPNKGYTKENVVFCCYELNGPTQWSREKLLLAFQKSDEEFTDYNDTLCLESPIRKAKSCSSKVDPDLDPATERRCKDCQQVKHPSMFSIRKGNYVTYNCKSCASEYNIRKRRTPEGKLRGLHIDARANSRGRNHLFVLTFEEIVAKYHEQKGRCGYSNIPMTFEGDWKVSLERLDPSQPYTKENIALICWEWNTFRQTSKAKFEHMKAHVLSTQ